MGLTLFPTSDGQVVGAGARALLLASLEKHGRATLLVGDYQEQQDASRELAQERRLGLGVDTTTPAAWATGIWARWGDGSKAVDSLTRLVTLQRALGLFSEAGHAGLSQGRGMLSVLARLAREGLPWILEDGACVRGGADAPALSGAERAAIKVLELYQELLHGAGYVEENEALLLVGRMFCSEDAPEALWPLVAMPSACAGRAGQTLLALLAQKVEVYVPVARENPRASARRDANLEGLRAMCGLLGTPFQVREAAPSDGGGAHTGPPRHTPELEQVLGCLFSGGNQALLPSGSVSLVLPAGPVAEAEALAREVERLVGEGCRDIVVSVPDTLRTWRELAPKLYARSLSVSGELSQGVTEIVPGRAFLALARSVATLAELDGTWPAAQPSPEGEMAVLGDMAWWPPRDLSDYLLSGISGVSSRTAYRLDASWRANRLLSPAEVLRTLQNPDKTSEATSRAVTKLLKGDVAAAASVLLAAIWQRSLLAGGSGDAPGEDADASGAMGDGSVEAVSASQDVLAGAWARGALTQIAEAARAVSAQAGDGSPATRAPLTTQLVDRLEQLLSFISVVVRPVATPARPRARVRILPRSRTARLPRCSVDAVVTGGLDSEASPIPSNDDVASAILDGLGIVPLRDPMDEVRGQFWHEVAAARTHFSAGRVLFDANSRPAYPAVMLSELLSCYGVVSEEGAGERGMRVSGLSETRAARNVSPASLEGRPAGSEVLAPAGVVSGSARTHVCVPPEGMPALLDGRPLLSASQIESYLECPLKWLSLRRLGLRDADAGFGPAEMGTFVHSVLERTHRHLLQEACEEAHIMLDGTPEQLPALYAHIPGSRIGGAGGADLEHAGSVLAEEFEYVRNHQLLLKGRRGRSQALVPHTPSEKGRLDVILQDLQGVLDFESQAFLGYEPRLFEWGFGRHGRPFSYAGAWIVGTVDRVDVDEAGNVLVIDYKHKPAGGFVGAYGAFAGLDEAGDAAGDYLPRHVQSLIYGQVVRRTLPNVRVRGALYLSTRGTGHTLSGALDADQVDRAFGSLVPGSGALDKMLVDPHGRFGQADEEGMNALLDATEERIARAVERLLDGDVAACPRDKDACTWCPVMNCERRLSK